MELSSLDHQGQARSIDEYFTDGQDPLEKVNWTVRTAQAGDFVQEGVEAPDFWSDMAVGITAKLYFATVDGERENSVRSMIKRVTNKITFEGVRHGYFENESDLPLENAMSWWGGEAEVFCHELRYLLVRQMASFNSPVWFNIGVPGRKQIAHACYLLQVKDSMSEITEWWATEARIFKSGGGSGTDLSLLRGSMEPLSTGGIASGPLAYLRASNAGAETLKSGGSHRRSAKFAGLADDHPDIEDFVDSKLREDERMKAMMKAGFNLDPSTSEGERTIAEVTAFQSSNNSVRATDEFMRRATQDDLSGEWNLIARTTGEVVKTINAKDLLDDIVDAAWKCADPGMIFIDTINSWHTTPSVGPIVSVNVCAEITQPPDTSCNLASLNLLKFVDGTNFFIKEFRHAIDVMVTALDINCSYSEVGEISEKIETNTREMRHLGLGYSNLGAALMAQGLAYDSDEARDWAASVTALMTGRAYWRSSEIAGRLGAHSYFIDNRDKHQAIIDRHIDAIPEQDYTDGLNTIWKAASGDWSAAEAGVLTKGLRNAQVTAIAPAGSISYLMGCDTTGIEPDFSLIKHKALAGGGTMKIVNGTVRRALRSLGYGFESTEQAVEAMLAGADIRKTIELDAVDRGPDAARVFDTANEIHPMGHLRMVAAVQPFVSQSISKTINLPNSATRDDIKQVYVEAWKQGCKAVSVYRDGSKATQVLTSQPKVAKLGPVEQAPGTIEMRGGPHPLPDNVEEIEQMSSETWEAAKKLGESRRRLPAERASITHKFSVGGHDGYITAGTYEDGTLGEFFLTGVGKEGSFLQGMMGAWSIACSIDFQRGDESFETLARKYVGMEFAPNGPTSNPEIPHAKSFPDYLFRWLVLRFGDVDLQEELGVMSADVKARLTARLDAQEQESHDDKMVRLTREAVPNGHGTLNAKPCSAGCGGLMYPSGTCFTCSSCAATTGCG